MTRLALDIETSGLHPWAPNAAVLLITTKDEKGKTTTIKGNDTKGIAKMKKLLEDPGITKIIHRSSFDCTYLAVQLGIYVTNILDTKLAELIICGEGEYARTSLKDCLAKYGLAKISKEEVNTFIGKTDFNFTKSQLEYARLDVEYMHALMDAQLRVIKRNNLDQVLKLENRVAEVTYRMRVNGIAFDTTRWLAIADAYQKTYDQLAFELDKHFDNNKTEVTPTQGNLFKAVNVPVRHYKQINWRSPAQVKKHFAIASYDDLPRMKGRDPWLDKFIALHSLSKFITTYGITWLEHERGSTLGPDGRVHTELNQIVSTGRYSSAFPNLQQIPKDTEHRTAFIASPGYKLVSGDFSGQEVAIMAYGSQDESWLNAIRRGDDLHSVMAKTLFSNYWTDHKYCTYPKKCECPDHLILRSKAKVFNFGLAYGKGPKTTALELGITVAEAMNVIKTFRRSAKQLARWLRDNGDSAVSNNEIRTLEPFNRYRNLSRTAEVWHKRNQGFNTPIQGTGADMLKLALWRVYEESLKPEWKGVRMLLCIHDEILTEAPIKIAERWGIRLAQIMVEVADYMLEPGLVAVEPVVSDRWKPIDLNNL